MSAVISGGCGENALVFLADLDLPQRALNALDRAGIRTVGQLAEWSEQDLLALPQFGQAGLAALRAAIGRCPPPEKGES